MLPAAFGVGLFSVSLRTKLSKNVQGIRSLKIQEEHQKGIYALTHLEMYKYFFLLTSSSQKAVTQKLVLIPLLFCNFVLTPLMSC